MNSYSIILKYSKENLSIRKSQTFKDDMRKFISEYILAKERANGLEMDNYAVELTVISWNEEYIMEDHDVTGVLEDLYEADVFDIEN